MSNGLRSMFMGGLMTPNQARAGLLYQGPMAQPQPMMFGAPVQLSQAAPADPHDFTDKYNTKLTPEEERAFQKQFAGRMNDLYNYDLRGAFKAGAQKAANGHLPDDFKKPNHPTFSDQSQYNNVDGFTGGQWINNPDGTWTFIATPTNLQFNDVPDLQRYFHQVEKGNTLKLPKGHR